MVRGLDKETSYEEFLLVIRAVEKRPGLYHRFNSINSPEARFEAWNEVAKETNLPAITCRERWRYARQVFVKHMRKENVGKSGDNLVKHLHFLKQHIVLKKPPTVKKTKNKMLKTNVELKEQDGTAEELRNVTMEAVEFLHNYNKQNSNDATLENMKTEHSDVDFPTDDVPSSPESDYDQQESVQPVAQLECENKTKEIFKDDTDLNFLKSMLPEMKMMSDRQKTLFKSKVMNVAIEILYGPDANKT